MTATGRPLRFLGFVLCGWLLFRIGAWSLSVPGEVEVAAVEAPAARPVTTSRQAIAQSTEPSAPLAGRRAAQWPFRAKAPETAFATPYLSPIAAMAIPTPGDVERAIALPTIATAPPAFQPNVPPAPPVASHRSPWSLTAWLLWRTEAGASLGLAPLLGGSQAGVRLDYRLWGQGDRTLSVYARLTRALERPFAEEAAAGVAVRPVAGLPVALLAERRVRLGEGGRDDFALLAAGGIAPQRVAERLEIEGYAQAGVVGLEEGDGFADGRLSLAYRLTPSSSQSDAALGISAWASAQPGATRVDVGPELRIRLPVTGGALRLSAEWRQRVAGTARPASGPAITLVADF